MNPKALANSIIAGYRITSPDEAALLLDCDLSTLCEAADRLRAHFCGDRVELCSIINGRSGHCPEDCKYCAQSAHHATSCEIYDFLPQEKIVALGCLNAKEGLDRYSIVTSGRSLSGEEFERSLQAYEALKECAPIDLCASMGFLSETQLIRLKNTGVTRYHCNLETSRRFFPQICTTHSFEQKLDMLRRVKAVGLQLCSGGILGMGEGWEDRIDMALTLAEVGVDSIPLNMLMPIKGTPLQDRAPMTEDEILRSVALFRMIVPTAHIRLGAGRALLAGDGINAFRGGASATITGNMLTTASCATIAADRSMLQSIGRTVKEL